MEVRAQVSLLVFLGLVVDNMLLTAVVPIVPDVLHEARRHRVQDEPRVAPEHVDGDVGDQEQRIILLGAGPAAPNYEKETKMVLAKDLVAQLLNRAQNMANVDNVDRDELEQYASFGSENFVVGALYSSKAFVQLIANPWVGHLVCTGNGDNLALIIGTTILLFSATLFTLSSNLLWMAVARSLQGLASSCISIGGLGLVARIYSDDCVKRTTMIGHVLSGIAVGVVIGYPIGGFGYAWIDRRAPFAFIACMSAALLGLEVRQLWSTTCTATTTTTTTKSSSSLISLLKQPPVLVASGAIWLTTSVMALLEPCLPIWVMDTMHPPKWQLGLVFLPDSLGYFLGAYFFGATALRLGRHKVAMVAMFTTAISAIAVTLARHMLELALPHLGIGLGLGVVDASLMPLLADLVDNLEENKGYGNVYAIGQSAVCLAYGLAPLLGGWMAQSLGFTFVMRAMGVLNLVYVPILIRLRTFTRTQSEEQRLKEQGKMYGTGDCKDKFDVKGNKDNNVYRRFD